MRPSIGNTLPILFLAGASAVAGNTGGEEQWLQYCSSRRTYAFVGDSDAVHPGMSSEPPEGVNLPEFEGPEPLFVTWETPMARSGSVHFALDRSRKHGQYDRLYVDSDGDGHLAGEESQRAYSVNRHSTQFGPIRVLFEGQDGPITYHVNLDVYGEDDKRAYLRTAGWYEGDVRIGGKTWRCRLVDYNADGAFDGRSMDFDKVDRIQIGTNGEFRTHFVGNYLEVEGRYYEPQPARDGALITFTPIENVPLGTVRLSADVTRVSAGGTNGLFELDPSDRTARLPAGEYRLREWVIEREDGKGIPWKASGSRFQDTFELEAGGEVVLEVGEPMASKLSVERQGDKFVFEQDIVGRLGERIQFQKRKRQPRAPKLLVRSEDGAFEKIYKFEYG